MAWITRFTVAVAFLAAGVIFSPETFGSSSSCSSSPSIHTALKLSHLLCFSTAWGAALWVTFIGGIIMFKHLPRHQFGNLQSKMFPAYFTMVGISCAISVAAFGYLHPWKSSSTTEKYQLGFLASAFLFNLINLVIFTPMTIEILDSNASYFSNRHDWILLCSHRALGMTVGQDYIVAVAVLLDSRKNYGGMSRFCLTFFLQIAWALVQDYSLVLSKLSKFSELYEMMKQRHKVERENNIGEEVGWSKNREVAKTNPQLAAMNKKFGMIHGLSSLANILAFGCLAMHSWYLAGRLNL
ncbi:hypothetical protein Cgig2_000719 [Carnegiea gigantea]|uniref:TMEM205-like domain-containing protein n=1 Tax=Carnegiea gigantea TaxID=171969 RepID=A0A9Q1KB68_9CARY|nr:hypothetical protein Cgig2_000719 [Carnegiea gigantea]